MVDDTERKMRHFPHNLLVVPEFKDAKHRTDGSMGDLQAYLLKLLDHRAASSATTAATGEGKVGGSAGYDVREYIRANPLGLV